MKFETKVMFACYNRSLVNEQNKVDGKFTPVCEEKFDTSICNDVAYVPVISLLSELRNQSAGVRSFQLAVVLWSTKLIYQFPCENVKKILHIKITHKLDLHRDIAYVCHTDVTLGTVVTKAAQSDQPRALLIFSDKLIPAIKKIAAINRMVGWVICRLR